MDQPVLVPFVERPELAEECIALINEEWPKSPTVRRMSLERSSNLDPPMAFVLLDPKREKLLGFARFLKVLNYNGNAGFFDTVVIRRSLRGQGLGRVLMDLLKEEAKRRGYELLIITTTDKERFYEKCGYTRCLPIQLVTKLTAASEKLATFMNFDRPVPIKEMETKKETTNSTAINASLPPAPPLPKINKPQGYKVENYLFCYI